MEHLDPVSVRLAGSIASRFASRGLKPRAAAPLVGMKPSTLYRRLNAESPFDSTELAAVAAFFGTTISELVSAAEDAA